MMAGFLYFLPNQAGVNEGILKRFKLDDRFDLAGLSCRQCDRGPGGMKGAVIGYDQKRTIGYYPDQQEWHEAPATDYWIGRWTDAPILPADLMRQETRPGHEVKLGDGHQWLVPVARLWPSGQSAFPEKLVLGAGDEWVREPYGPYVELCQNAERVWRRVMIDTGLIVSEEIDPREKPLDDVEAVGIAIRALSVNYRIGRVEASELGLLTTTDEGTIIAILEVFVGLPDLVAINKAMEIAKKNDGAADTQPGNG